MYPSGWKHYAWVKKTLRRTFVSLWKNCFSPFGQKNNHFFLWKQKFTSEFFCPWHNVSTQKEHIFPKKQLLVCRKKSSTASFFKPGINFSPYRNISTISGYWVTTLKATMKENFWASITAWDANKKKEGWFKLFLFKVASCRSSATWVCCYTKLPDKNK